MQNLKTNDEVLTKTKERHIYKI